MADSTNVDTSPPPRAGARPAKAIAAAALVVAVVALAAIAIFVFAGGDDPGWAVVGLVEDFPANEPVRIEEHGIYVVRLESGEFVALSERTPYEGCVLAWRPDLFFKGHDGWFHERCSTATYDLTGRCFAQCTVGVDRHPVRVRDGQLQVGVEKLLKGPPADPQAEPINPPAP